MRPVIAVVGGHSCSPDETIWGTMVGRLLAEQGAVLVCGGLGGVMEAAAKGAKSVAGGVTVGILPGTTPGEANPYIDVALATGMGEMRNALLVRVAQGIIAIGGGPGTLSEVALAKRMGTPIVGLHDAFTNAIDIARVTTPAEAVRWVLEHAGGKAV